MSLKVCFDGGSSSRGLGMLLVVAASLALQAADTEDYSSYLSLQSNDINRDNSSFTRANWGPENLSAAEGGKYFVPEGMTMYTPAGKAVFPGDELALAGKIIAGNTGGYWNNIGRLRMLPGAIYQHNSNNNLSSSNLVVLGTAGNPVAFNWFVQKDKIVQYNGEFIGAKDAVMRFTRGAVTELDRDTALTTMTLINADLSEYFGRLILDVGTYMNLSQKNEDFETTGINYVYPGTVELMKDSILAPYSVNNATNVFGGLVLNPGSEMMFYVHRSNEKFIKSAVTNVFSASGDFRVGFRYTAGQSDPVGFNYTKIGCNGTIPLIHLTGPAAETEVDFSEATITNLVLSNTIGNLPSNVRLGLVDNADGTKDVCVKWDPVLEMNVVNASNGDNKPLAFRDGECWPTGEVPDTNFVGNVLVTASALGLQAWKNVSRTNMILTVKSGTTVYHQGNDFKLKELHMVGGSQVLSYAGGSAHSLHGKLVIWPGSGPVKFRGWGGHRIDVYSEISGSGEILLANYHPQFFSMELFGTNLNYSGSFTVDSHPDSFVPESGTDKCATLYLNDGRNLGGPYSGEAAWKAFTVKGHSNVEVRDDVTLDEPTRGVYVENAARFRVPEGKTLAVNQNITFAGKLEKLGAGRLSLGGGALFIDGDPATAPVAGTNRLVVSEGVLKVTSTNALDGVAVTFAAGTALELDAFPSGDGMAERGIVNTKWSVPFAAEGNVKVVFADDGREMADSATTAICTVDAAAAYSLPVSVSGRLRDGFYTKVSFRDNGDGTVTVLAEHQRMGTRIIVR